MLYFLKILVTMVTAGLAIFAVTTDFTDKDRKTLKPAGRWYIGIFILSVGLSFLLDTLSDRERDQKATQTFNATVSNIRDSTDTLLRRTKDSLNFQFARI